MSATGASVGVPGAGERRHSVTVVFTGLMMLAAFLLLKRPDLDREPSPHDTPDTKQARTEKPRTEQSRRDA